MTDFSKDPEQGGDLVDHPEVLLLHAPHVDRHGRRLAVIRWLEPLPQRGHQARECLGGGGRWRLAPQLIDQAIRGDDLAGMQCEHTQQ